MAGKLYGVGVGPGDPELMTVKAVRVINECGAIAIPTETIEKCTAYQIAKQTANVSCKKIIPVPVPMTKDRIVLKKAYEKGKSSNAQVVVFRSDQYREDLNEFVQVKWTLREKQIPPYRPMNCRSFTGNIFKVFVGWAWDKLFERKFVEENHLKFQQIRTSNDMLFVFSALAFAQRMEIVDLVLAHQRRNNPNSLSNTREKSWDCFHTALNALKDALTAHGNFWEFEQDYINYALHFSLWHLDTITGAKKEVLFNKLKNEWFAEFGIDSLPAERFYDKKEYAKYLKIKSNEFNAYYEE